MDRARQLVWPSAGWHRTLRYLRHRIARLPGSPYSIAAGLATGVAVSFTPFIGLHLVIVASVCWIIRGNIVAAVAGTAVANPWTLPLIWLWIYYLGRLLLPSGRYMLLPADLNLSFVLDHPWNILVPMTVGGMLSAAVAWALTYFPIRAAVAARQERRRARLR
ncbi:MAG TPA: DUF2062 domain-containing protein, partial [Candidatus Sulfotelmatobacter sp.]|nr:DUF2062 domain-containing protein [Candidatus Sulfotelmatobacter sp.]